jgi:CheY-like chemotaxis protein
MTSCAMDLIDALSEVKKHLTAISGYAQTAMNVPAASELMKQSFKGIVSEAKAAERRVEDLSKSLRCGRSISTDIESDLLKNQRKPTVLVIDDENSIRQLLKRTLEKIGCTVYLAEDGAAGVQAYKKNSIDLVITDLVMPEKEGIEVIRELKMENAEVQIIAISGGGLNAPGTYLDIAKALGARQVFAKPIIMEDFLNTVKFILSESNGASVT